MKRPGTENDGLIWAMLVISPLWNTQLINDSSNHNFWKFSILTSLISIGPIWPKNFALNKQSLSHFIWMIKSGLRVGNCYTRKFKWQKFHIGKFINYTKIILYLKPLSVSKVQFFAIHLQHQLTYLRANVNVRQDRMFCMIFLCLINRNVFCNIYFTFILRAVTSTLDIWKNSVKTHCWNVVFVPWFELHFSKFSFNQ